MATRSMIQFGYQDETGFHKSAQLYNHWDGYPESRLLDIKAAIERAHKSYNSEAGYQYRVQSTYPTDLAAFYILEHKTGAGNIEVDEHLHGDLSYIYQVWQNPDNGTFNVNILRPIDGFWDSPELKYTEQVGSGELEDLLVKYKEMQCST